MKPKPDAETLKAVYKETFNTDAGQLVLEDLERIVAQLTIENRNPNPNAAIWKVAQLDIVKRIRKMIND